MKRISVFSLMFLLSACAEGSIYKQFDQDCNDHFYSSKACPAKQEIVQKKESRNRSADLVSQSRQNKVRLVAQNERLPIAPQPVSQVAQRRVYIEQQPTPRVMPVETVKIEAPAPLLIAESTPAVITNNGCNGCEPIVTQTREPVEVIYKKTTYTTVFEPKTTSTVTYEKEPIVNQKYITNTQVVKQADIKQVPVQRKRIRRVVTKTQPTVNSVSYTIENTHTTTPSELLIEEIK